MLSWEDIIEKYITKHSDQIRKITRPLRDRFGIEYFTYHGIDSKRHYTVLVDRPDWAEHYVSIQLYLEDPFLRHPSVYEPGICVIGEQGSPIYQETVKKLGEQVFQTSMGLVQIERTGDGVEFFGCTGRNPHSLYSLYLNHGSLLKSFSQYFKSELGSILSCLKDEPSFLPDLKGKDFFVQDPIGPEIDQGSCYSFLEDIGFAGAIKLADSLTKRQKECLTLLLAHKNAKETAAILNLSPRTIEFYFENIKDKLGCFSKSDIIEIALTFRELGLL